jgi:hypothetical protein
MIFKKIFGEKFGGKTWHFLFETASKLLALQKKNHNICFLKKNANSFAVNYDYNIDPWLSFETLHDQS